MDSGGLGAERPLIMCFLRHLSEEEAFETLSKECWATDRHRPGFG
jgi:hypothetical protein